MGDGLLLSFRYVDHRSKRSRAVKEGDLEQWKVSAIAQARKLARYQGKEPLHRSELSSLKSLKSPRAGVIDSILVVEMLGRRCAARQPLR